MADFPSYEDAPWILDAYHVQIEQRSVTDADFVKAETYDGEKWDEFDSESKKQVTKRKYISRRKVTTVKAFKVENGKYFIFADISSFLSTAKQSIPSARLPYDKTWGMPYDWNPGEGFLMHIGADFTKDGNVTIKAEWRQADQWELILMKE